jgi:hypothetical protein
MGGNVNPTLNQKDRQASGKAPAAGGKNSASPGPVPRQRGGPADARQPRQPERPQRLLRVHAKPGRHLDAAHQLQSDAPAGEQPPPAARRRTQLGKPIDNGSAARDQAIQGAYSQAKSRLDPRFEQEGNQLASQLAAQGLDPNSQAYRTAMENYGRSKNDAYSSAMNGAIAQGTAAQAATFQENMQARQAPLSELNQLHGLLGQPGYSGAGDYAQQQAMRQQMMTDALQGGTQLGKSLGGMAQPGQGGSPYGGGGGYVNPAGYDDQGWGNYPSDARIKTDIQPLPFDATDGVPFSTFRYSNDPSEQKYLGVIAQDLEKVAPEHVTEAPSGVKMVSKDFAPVPVPEDGAPPLPPMPVDDQALTPEERQALTNINTAPEQSERLEQQRAMAQALQHQNLASHHSSPIGAALGGVADILDTGRGRNQEAAVDERQRSLIEALGRARTAYGDAATRMGRRPQPLSPSIVESEDK